MPLVMRDCVLSKNRLPQDSELLYERLRLLPSRDREIMCNILIARQSLSSVARILKIPRYAVARRVRKLAKIVTQPAYRHYRLVNLRLSVRERMLARQHFVEGRSLRWMARQHKTSVFRMSGITSRLASKMEAMAAAGKKIVPADPLNQSNPTKS